MSHTLPADVGMGKGKGWEWEEGEEWAGRGERVEKQINKSYIHTANPTHLASKERESAASRLEELQNTSDERVVAVLLQVSLKADKGALLLGGHVYCEVSVTLERGEGR